MTHSDIPSQRSLALWCALPLHLFLVGGKQFSLYSLLACLSRQKIVYRLWKKKMYFRQNISYSHNICFLCTYCINIAYDTWFPLHDNFGNSEECAFSERLGDGLSFKKKSVRKSSKKVKSNKVKSIGKWLWHKGQLEIIHKMDFCFYKVESIEIAIVWI